MTIPPFKSVPVDPEILKLFPEGRIMRMSDRESDLQAALDLALCRLSKFEPGDSRAVSNEFVAMAAVSCNITTDEDRNIIKSALSVEICNGR